MIADSALDVARRLRHGARANRLAVRYWAGWRLQLTFGPYDRAFDTQTAEIARSVVEQVAGAPPPDPGEAERDVWHLSVSWRGGHPAEPAKLLLADLVEAIGVPESDRQGEQVARVYAPGGLQSPQVTHWTWRDEP